MLITHSTWLHLRLPFSFFLLPVWLFAFAVSPDIYLEGALLSFVILHFLVYPASNGFNSYYDRDEDSIGGLKHPPKVSRDLLFVSLVLDGIALILSLLVSWEFAFMIFLFGMVSKAYSYKGTRWKRFPVLSFLAATIFQGGMTFLASYMAINEVEFRSWTDPGVFIPAILSTGMLMGFYPMTQIYQHDSDARRGDLTISRLLGIRGTFRFVLVVFLLMDLAFIYYLQAYQQVWHVLLFQLCLLPAAIYFIFWMRQAFRHTGAVTYEAAMRLNLLGAAGMNLFFGVLFW